MEAGASSLPRGAREVQVPAVRARPNHDHSPDVCEAITDEQLCEAIAEWLTSKGRMQPGVYSAQTFIAKPEGVHLYKAWRRPT